MPRGAYVQVSSPYTRAWTTVATTMAMATALGAYASFWNDVVSEVESILKDPQKMAEILVETSADIVISSSVEFTLEIIRYIIRRRGKGSTNSSIEKRKRQIERVLEFFENVHSSTLEAARYATGVSINDLKEIFKGLHFVEEEDVWYPPRLRLSVSKRRLFWINLRRVLRGKRPLKMGSSTRKKWRYCYIRYIEELLFITRECYFKAVEPQEHSAVVIEASPRFRVPFWSTGKRLATARKAYKTLREKLESNGWKPLERGDDFEWWEQGFRKLVRE